jgi:hypothetical protein
MFGELSLGQTTKILYITPDFQTGGMYDKIRTKVAEELRTCLQEKWLREITNTTWERSPNKSKVLQSLRVNYVLRLGQLPVIKGTDRNVKINFQLIYVDENFKTQELIWNNSVYVLELNDSKAPTNVKDVVSDVCEEVDFFLNSSEDPDMRKFRPRIKIDGFDLSSEEIEEIDLNAFRKWLKEILEDKFAEDQSYVFYFSRKYDKQYPENSIYQITGKFNKYQTDDDNLVKVQITIELPNAFDVKPVEIHTEKFVSDAKRKNELVNNIVTVIEKNINYYGVD